MDHAEGEKLSGARKSGTADGGTLEKPAGFGQGLTRNDDFINQGLCPQVFGEKDFS